MFSVNGYINKIEPIFFFYFVTFFSRTKKSQQQYEWRFFPGK